MENSSNVDNSSNVQFQGNQTFTNIKDFILNNISSITIVSEGIYRLKLRDLDYILKLFLHSNIIELKMLNMKQPYLYNGYFHYDDLKNSQFFQDDENIEDVFQTIKELIFENRIGYSISENKFSLFFLHDMIDKIYYTQFELKLNHISFYEILKDLTETINIIITQFNPTIKEIILFPKDIETVYKENMFLKNNLKSDPNQDNIDIYLKSKLEENYDLGKYVKENESIIFHQNHITLKGDKILPLEESKENKKEDSEEKALESNRPYEPIFTDISKLEIIPKCLPKRLLKIKKNPHKSSLNEEIESNELLLIKKIQQNSVKSQFDSFDYSEPYLAIGLENGEIHIYNLIKKKFEIELIGHEAAVSDLGQLDDIRICSSSADKTIKIWDFEIARCLFTFNTYSPVRSLIVLDNNTMVSSMMESNIVVWNLNKELISFSLNEHVRFITALAKLNNKIIASSSADKSIKIWDLVSKSCLKNFYFQNTSVVMCMEFIGSDKLATGFNDGTFKIWNFKKGIPLYEVAFSGDIVYSILRLDSKYLAISTAMNLIFIFDHEINQEIKRISKHSDSVVDMEAINSNLFSSCSDDLTIRFHTHYLSEYMKIWNK